MPKNKRILQYNIFLIPFFIGRRIETQISADTITVEKGEILRAEGNVLVQYGSSRIKQNLSSLIKNLKKLNLQN